MSEPLSTMLIPFHQQDLRFILLTNAIRPPRRQFIARRDSRRIVDHTERFTTTS